MPSPPTTPQRMRETAQRAERDQRVLVSPEIRRIASTSALPVPPFALPSQGGGEDPFGPVPGPVNFHGQTYHNLDPNLAARLAALTPTPPDTRQRRPRQPAPQVPVVRQMMTLEEVSTMC